MTHNESSPVKQLRIILEVDDMDAAVTFFRDKLGLPEQAAFEGDGDARVSILPAGAATLELANPAQQEMIDRLEADGARSTRVRLAFEVDDTEGTTRALTDSGAELVAAPRETPWRSVNSRLRGPVEWDVTLFQELESLDERSARPGFAGPGE